MASQTRYLGLILLVFVALAGTACSNREPLPTLVPLSTYTPVPTYTPLPTYTPVPRAIPVMDVQKKEVVEKIVVHTVVHTLVVTATSSPTPTATLTLTATPISIPIITPIPTPTTETPIPLLEAFEARIDIVLQVGAAVHNVTWNLKNNSQQKVKVVGEIRRANGTIIARAESSGFVDPNGEIGSFSTTFITTPTHEEVMAFQWVWTIQTQTSQTIVCTFTKANPKSCVYTSTSTPTPTAEPEVKVILEPTPVRAATARPAPTAVLAKGVQKQDTLPPTAADFELADSSGSTVSLSKTLSDSHFAVLVFYRGHF